MAGSVKLKMVDISNISIFPVLFMILLAEEFTRTQLTKSKKAINLTVGTLGLAVLGSVAMEWREVQKVVLTYPVVIIIVTVIINLVVGNYTGIRLSEIKRFRKAIRKK